MSFPKGSAGKSINLDGAIFDDAAWLTHFTAYWATRDPASLKWLGEHLLVAIEFKRQNKSRERVLLEQLRPAMREKEPSTAYVLGVYYADDRLFLFHRRNGVILRYDESKNAKGDSSSVGDLSLQLSDPYDYLPSLPELLARVSRPATVDRSKRTITALEVITSIGTAQHKDALSHVLRTLTSNGLFNQRGYRLFIETLAMKIYDEKRNDARPSKLLKFYVDSSEAAFASLGEPGVQRFVSRMQGLYADAERSYRSILGDSVLDWKNEAHVRAVISVCESFQDYSFVRSATFDLYQLVFYNFANEFKRSESAQFLTPLPVIEFMVRLTNPVAGELVCDPCCGIADFLSLAFVHARTGSPTGSADEKLHGVDLHDDMIMLATLNMLLNGDGEAHLNKALEYGSLLYKIALDSSLVALMPGFHENGNWDSWPDKTKLLKFDVVLTNPPFGEDRALRPKTQREREIVSFYEVWGLKGGGDNIDLGVMFLENAVRILKPGGRLAIVLSNSIASINRWRRVREWFLSNMRLVAMFDLPANVFAETGVNTTIIVAYKPQSLADLNSLQSRGYEVFAREIEHVGYEKRTAKRNVYFKSVYRFDLDKMDVAVDSNGQNVLLEDFSETIEDFQAWAVRQEMPLARAFLQREST